MCFKSFILGLSNGKKKTYFWIGSIDIWSFRYEKLWKVLSKLTKKKWYFHPEMKKSQKKNCLVIFNIKMYFALKVYFRFLLRKYESMILFIFCLKSYNKK